LPYIEPTSGAGKGLLAALAEHASVVVADEFPCCFLPRMVASAARQLPVLLEEVDSNALLPLRATGPVAQPAFDFQRYLQKELPKHLVEFPHADPLAKARLVTPQEAAKLMIHLNNKYALDGRNPNSYSRIFWCWDAMTGRGDQSGLFSIPCKSSQNTARKVFVKNYIRKYSAEDRESE
jgi:hypothetical protein